MHTTQAAARSPLSLAELQQLVPGQRVFESAPVRSGGLVLWQYQSPAALDQIVVGNVAAHWLIVHLQHDNNIECRFPDHTQRRYSRPGDLIVVPYDTPTAWRWQGTPDALHLLIEPSLVRSVALEAGDIDPARVELVPRLAVPDPLAEQLGRALLDEHERRGGADSLYLESLTHTLVVHVLRHYTTLRQSVPAAHGGLARSQLHHALDYIDAHLEQNIALDALAAAANLSPYHFARMFKRATGHSPYQYVLQRRVERAVQLLQDARYSIAEIAARTGFADQSHLTRHVKRVVGVTPRTIQQRKNVPRGRKNVQDR